MTTIATLVANLGLDASEFNRGAAEASKSASGLGASLNSALSTAGGFLMANVAMKAFESATSAVSGGVIGMNANLQKSTLQFETLMGNADQAKAHVAMLFDFARATPFETQPVIDASRMLQTFGGVALNTKANLYLVGDAAAATNAPIQELGFWVGRAYSAIQAGRPFGEAAMRLQELAVLSPQARTEMENLQAAGASVDQVWTVMAKDLGRFEGAMKRQAGTWEGLTSTFSDTMGILSATAFKPFFEAASGGLQKINNALGREEVTRWAERVAAGLQVAMRAFGTLASTVGSSLGSVLSIVTTVGKAIYTALQWINPFARHSPPLVEQVQAGVEMIAQAYATLAPAIQGDLSATESAVQSFEDAVSSGAARVADNTTKEMEKLLGAMGPDAFSAWRSATDAVAMLEVDLGDVNDRLDEAKGSLKSAEDELGRLEDAARQSKDQVKDLEDQLSGAERALRSFTTTPLQGSQAFSDALFENEQQAKRLQLQLANMKTGGAAKKDLEKLQDELDKVQAAGEAIRLKEDLELGPQRRELEKLGNLGKEITFNEAKTGALAARQAIDKLGPAIDAAKSQSDAAEAAAAKQKLAVEEQKAGLEAIKARYDELKQSVDDYNRRIEDMVKSGRELEALNKAKAGAGGAAGAGNPEDLMKALGTGGVSPIVEEVKQVEGWVNSANAAVDAFSSRLFGLQVALGAVGHAFGLLFDPSTRQIGIDYFVGLFGSIQGEVHKWTANIGDTVRLWAAQFINWAVPQMPALMAKYNEVKLGILNWIVQTVPGLIDGLADWAGTFIGWVGPIIPPMLAELGAGFQGMLNWILVKVPVLGAQLGLWANRLITWILEAAPGMIVAAQGYLEQLLAWIVENVPMLINTIGGYWLPTFVNWVLDAALQIVPNLLTFLTNVMNWIIEKGPDLTKTFLSQWLPAAIGWIAQAAIDMLPKLVSLLGTITLWIITEGVPKLLEFGAKMGLAILQGTGDGLRNLGSKLAEWVTDAIHSIHIDFGWIVIDGRAGVTFNIPTPNVGSGPGGGNAAADAAQREADWIAAGSPDWNAINGYASGGIAWEPQMASLAESGPEAIIPLSVLDRVAAFTNEGPATADAGDTFIFKVDARESAITERELYRQAQRARLLRSMGGA